MADKYVTLKEGERDNVLIRLSHNMADTERFSFYVFQLKKFFDRLRPEETDLAVCLKRFLGRNDTDAVDRQ